ncbi:MAG: adenosylcobinamide-phosphate synthase CbiB [Anaerolineales bacterium]|nr:adenosylcobinamide-phosphate synthase CbiB [Anaerolineales bacterium]
MALLLAWLLDVGLGEPPPYFHPVVWMGSYLRTARRLSPPTFTAGAAAWLLGATVVLAIAFALQAVLVWVSVHAGAGVTALLTALALKPLFAWRALRQAAETVIEAPDLSGARRMLSWHLVSRDTTDLTAGEVHAATIESVAENLSDSLVAPLLYYVLGGLPLAALYRFANTADAMWGYRTPELEKFGKWAARTDDVLNLIPSRLTALLLCLVSPLAGLDARRAWRVWRRDRKLTASPNAGQPMSAMSGALGVNLSKRGYYVLGAEFREPDVRDVRRALRLCTLVAWLVALTLSGLSILLQFVIGA